MKKKKGIYRRFFIFAIILASLKGTGMTYAKWSEGLQANLSLTTGIMDVRYAREMPCYMSLVDEKGKELLGRQEVSAAILNEGKEMNMTAMLPIYTEEFLYRSDSLIKLEIPITTGKNGTIETVEMTEADFSEEAREELLAEVDRISLIREDTGEAYPISRDEVAPFDEPLAFYVFRETTGENGNVTSVIYLKMQEESRNHLSETPLEIRLDREEEESASFGASLMVSYYFSLPIYTEQGHEDTVFLEENA